MYAADNLSRQHFQMYFLFGTIRYYLDMNCGYSKELSVCVCVLKTYFTFTQTEGERYSH